MFRMAFIHENEHTTCSPILPLPADHIYDTEGCTFSLVTRDRKIDRAKVRVLAGWWNDPGNYDLGFDTCAADTVVSPPGECAYAALPLSFLMFGKTHRRHLADIRKDGTTSTFYHGQKTTPTAHPPAKSSLCKVQATIKPGKYPPKKMTTVGGFREHKVVKFSTFLFSGEHLHREGLLMHGTFDIRTEVRNASAPTKRADIVEPGPHKKH